jgi:hypothetical protein
LLSEVKNSCQDAQHGDVGRYFAVLVHSGALLFAWIPDSRKRAPEPLRFRQPLTWSADHNISYLFRATIQQLNSLAYGRDFWAATCILSFIIFAERCDP